MRAACLAWLALAVAAVAAGCGDDEETGERPRLVVSAASSMTEALGECGREYPDARVKLSFAGSDELAAQIRQGVRPDVYAAANTKLPEALRREGLLGGPVEFATNELVIVVPAGSTIQGVGDLAREDVKLAVGSESVPVGSYTREVLSRLPALGRKAILANVRSNEPDVKGIVGKLVQGAADAGFVYESDVKATGGKLASIALSKNLRPEVVYAAGVVEGAKEPDAAQRFLEGLVDGGCARSLRTAGFGPPPG